MYFYSVKCENHASIIFEKLFELTKSNQIMWHQLNQLPQMFPSTDFSNQGYKAEYKRKNKVVTYYVVKNQLSNREVLYFEFENITHYIPINIALDKIDLLVKDIKSQGADQTGIDALKHLMVQMFNIEIN